MELCLEISNEGYQSKYINAIERESFDISFVSEEEIFIIINYCKTGLKPFRNEYTTSNSVSGGITMNDIIKENLEKIQDISQLKDDWNGNGASAFKDTLIKKMKYLILRLNIQPEIFPTACDSIQFEYEKETGEYLEFELFDTRLKVFTMDSDGNDYSYDMDIDIEEINKVVDKFYG